VGTQVILSVFGDVGGTVGGEIAKRVGTIDKTTDTAWDYPSNPALDVYTAHGDFAGISLAAGTYWFSMSGWGTLYQGPDLGWPGGVDIGTVFFREDGAPRDRYDQAFIGYAHSDVLGERVFSDHTSTYRLPFLVDGQVAGVPEPATWGLLLAGFAFAGTALRQRRRARLSGTCNCR
jgi:hypothetical protein